MTHDVMGGVSLRFADDCRCRGPKICIEYTKNNGISCRHRSFGLATSAPHAALYAGVFLAGQAGFQWNARFYADFTKDSFWILQTGTILKSVAGTGRRRTQAGMIHGRIRI